MTDPIAIPTLSRWAEEHVTALFKTSEKNLDSVYDNTFSRDCKITVNGQHMTGEQFKQRIRSEKWFETGAQVAFTGTVEVPDSQNNSHGPGSVGLFVHATVDKPYMTLGEPDSNTVRASYNMRIVEDFSLPQPEGRAQIAEWDSRRIAAMTDVSMERPNRILPGGPHRREL